jgi:hypothetical protein
LPAEDNGVKKFFRKLTTTRRVERLIRDGVGVREAVWQVEGLGEAEADVQLAAEMVSWVRRQMGEMRRPYGIDHVALALACRDASGTVVCSNSLGVVRPESFYSEAGQRSVEGFLADARRAAGEGPLELVGALLSLGDIAFELNLGRAAA